MPDRRLHRGPHPEDARLFAPAAWGDLRRAVEELSWLLSRDYAIHSALKLVGDRYQLAERQRLAVMRGSCSDASLRHRQSTELAAEAIAGHVLHLDGYNVLTTVESALAGAVVLAGRDGCYRDMASMHGHYKRVHETGPALLRIGQSLASLGVAGAAWLLDAPVSNSGRLKTMMLQTAAEQGWPWTVELVHDPDAVLASAEEAISTADSVVLDGPRRAMRQGLRPRWFNLTRRVIAEHVSEAWIVDIGRAEASR